MTEFSSPRDFRKFRNIVRRKRRYIRDEATEQFLAAVLETAKKRAVTLAAPSAFWRAQIGYEEPEDDESYRIDALGPDRMIPLHNRAREGRINPKGIPCLYLATNRETAIAEVRPGRHTLVSVGLFEIDTDLLVVDCSSDDRKWPIRPTDSIPPRDREGIIWGDINWEFSRPVDPSESHADYVPTQIVAELFRHHGYDGVVYSSSVAKGHNVAFFDTDAAKLTMCELHTIDTIEYRTSEIANPYYIDSKGESPSG